MTNPAPSIGRIVIYRAKTRDYDVPAIITATTDSLDPEGVARGDVAPLSSPTHVHLHVLTPGAARHYQEHDVPMNDVDATGTPPRHPPLAASGSWRWPERK